MQEVTIVIPNYNGKTLLENCIKTLEKQTCKNFRVLVVDNGSTDGSVEWMTEHPEYELIALKENTGFCKAVNIGIEHTKTEFVILLNNDTEVEEHFVEALLEGIKSSEHIFSCAAKMLDYKDHEITDSAGDLYTALGWAVARGKGKPAEKYQKECAVFSCCAGAAIYRMSAIREVGMLDEHHFAYLEDVDLGYRARIYGYRNRYVPKAEVYHVGSATTGSKYNEKKVYLSARNSMFVIYKNMPVLQMLLNLPFLFAGVLIKTLFFTRKGLAKKYLSGICDGIRQCYTCRKVPFRVKNLTSYVRIQLELWGNMFRILIA